MEKVHRFIILAFFIAQCFTITAQNETLGNKSPVLKELYIEAGIDLSRMNDTINEHFGGQPYITFYYENFCTQRFRYTLFVTPVAIHQTLNANRTSRQRFFHIEGGASAGYSIFNNFWISAGGGYSYRFLNQIKLGANSWQKHSYEQPGLFFFGSGELWITTSLGLRFSSLIFTDGYVFKIGAYANIRSIKNKLKKL
ncbi:MAG TPA: hypothetical protein PK990_04375 [Salinivirgaceae bacterium]|nr:hypothetical protein [Salinivirgaceae bacterium]